MSWLLVPLAILLGAVLTTQVATNTQLGKALGNSYIPATVNMMVAFAYQTMQLRRSRYRDSRVIMQSLVKCL